MVRQSSAAILDASSDAKLAKAFEQIEQLSKELGEANTKIKHHVRSSQRSPVTCVSALSECRVAGGRVEGSARLVCARGDHRPTRAQVDGSN